MIGLFIAPVTAGPRTYPLFTDTAAESGLRFRHNFGAEHLQNILMTTGNGCALFDYDNDGWLDAFMVNGTFLDKNGRPDPHRATRHALFHNEGNGSFKNVTASAGITKATYGQGCAIGDFDGDGFADIYLTNYGPNQMYRNRGDGTFEDVTDATGTGSARWSGGAVFFDYDGDGDLDLFVSGYVKFRMDMKVHASAHSKRKGYRVFPGPRDYEAEDDILYRNDGDGTFTDVSREAGILEGGKGLTVVAADFDNDGDQDLFVANDSTPNFFYENDKGTFMDVALEAGVAFDPDGAETAAMGIAVADVDGDGRLDFYVTNMIFEFNNFYRNQGDLMFEDITKALKLDKDNYRHVGWATHFADFNHDGFLDCFVANGHVVDYVEGFSQSITYAQQSLLFVGNAKGSFINASTKCGNTLKKKRVGRGAAFGDYDNDGDVDILVLNSGGRAELLRNDTATGGHWLKIRLKGRSPNTQAIGAKVVTQVGTRKILSEVRAAGSYLSSSDPTVHVGLGAEIAECVVSIRWPSGRTSSRKVPLDALAVMEEPE